MKRAVLVGMGNMGKNHLRVLRESNQFDLVGVVDPFPVEKDIGLPLFGSIAEALELKPECAVVATPTQTHFQIVGDLLDAGLHVLVEKPSASTHEESVSLLQKAETKNLHLAVGHIERQNPVVASLEKVIAKGWIGKPVHVKAQRMGPKPANVVTGNHVVLDLAVHELDVIRKLLGPIQVHGSSCQAPQGSDIIESSEILLKSQNGVSAAVSVSWYSPLKKRELTVFGTKGMVEIDYIGQTCSVFPQGTEDLGGDNSLKKISQGYQVNVERKEPLKLQLEQFYSMLEGKEHSLCIGDSLTESVELVEKIVEKSMARNRNLSTSSRDQLGSL